MCLVYEKINLKATPPSLMTAPRDEGHAPLMYSRSDECAARLSVWRRHPYSRALRFSKGLVVGCEFVVQLPINSVLSRCNYASAILTKRTGLFNFL